MSKLFAVNEPVLREQFAPLLFFKHDVFAAAIVPKRIVVKHLHKWQN